MLPFLRMYGPVNKRVPLSFIGAPLSIQPIELAPSELRQQSPPLEFFDSRGNVFSD